MVREREQRRVGYLLVKLAKRESEMREYNIIILLCEMRDERGKAEVSGLVVRF